MSKFWSSFSKSLRGGGAAPPFAAFFFLIDFSFAPTSSKEKSANKSSLTNSLFTYINPIATFSLQTGGAKKTLSKRNAEVCFACCDTRQGLRALDGENFWKKVLSKTFPRGVCEDFEIYRYTRLLLSREILISPSGKRSRLSSDLPVPIATHETASFATRVLIPVTCSTSLSKP